MDLYSFILIFKLCRRTKKNPTGKLIWITLNIQICLGIIGSCAILGILYYTNLYQRHGVNLRLFRLLICTNNELSFHKSIMYSCLG